MKSWTIAFTRGGDIWTARGDGTEQKRVIENGASPSWSPDKKKIAFARSENVWVANSEGSSQRQLTHLPRPRARAMEDDEIEISWRPGKCQLTFSRPEEFEITCPADDYTLTRSGTSVYDVYMDTNQHVRAEDRYDVTDAAAGALFSENNSPAWSPDGERLAFVRNGDIWLSERQTDPGSRQGFDCTRLSPVAAHDAPTWRADRFNLSARHLSWSPDGKALAYEYGRGYGDDEIRLTAMKGTETGWAVGDTRILVDDSNGCGEWPSLSPDGRLVLYQQWDGVHIVSADGRFRRKLIANAAQPDW